ncbi:hypothetical protein J3R82DRAFT_5041 [Butyriboletus roseoflavus]|nr:hypothetical protein J3R82DRAFT_5041 [Butyriboletus roseoflavus]
MLATHTLSLSLHSSPPTARPSLFSGSRPALADSTNVNSRSNACGPGYPKGSVYPTSSARTGCGWSDFESTTGYISTSCHSRQPHVSSAPSLFPVAQKAPPTVSISLSAACSQSILGERFCGSKVQGLEPDLPDVKSVVPFPITPLDSDTDVVMLDGTCVPCPDGHLPSAGQAPRKRRSAHSSVSSSQGSLGKNATQKRQRKSRRHVAELWGLGVVYRSILRAIEDRQSIGELDASDGLLSGLRDFDAMDRVLVEKIQKRLAENGCVEGRALPNPLPRISSPSISAPCLTLSAPSRKTPAIKPDSFTLPSELNPKWNDTLDGTTTSPPASNGTPRASLPITSHCLIPSARSTSHRRYVHFEIPQRPCQGQPHPSIPRRSPSPPARTGTVPTNVQMLTLTMPQLVAALTLAYRERGRLRLRGRTYKVTECGNNADRSVPYQAVPCSDGDAIHNKERVHQSFTPRVRLSSTPERKSPLSRVAYAES